MMECPRLASAQAELLEPDQALQLDSVERADLRALQPSAPAFGQAGGFYEQQVQRLAARGRLH